MKTIITIRLEVRLLLDIAFQSELWFFLFRKQNTLDLGMFLHVSDDNVKK